MKSVINWTKEKIKKVTNFAASGLLRIILNKYLVNPLDNESCLLINSDWSVDIHLKDINLLTSQINSFLPFLTVESVFITKIDYQSEFNLSKQKCVIGKILINVDLDEVKNSKMDVIDQETIESLENLKESMPMDKDESLMNWFIDNVEMLSIDIGSILINAKIDNKNVKVQLNQITFSTNVNDKKLLFFGNVDKFSVKVGFINSSISAIVLQTIYFIFVDNILTIRSPRGVCNFTDSFLHVMAKIVNVIREQPDSDSNLAVCFQVTDLGLSAVHNFTGIANNVNIFYQNKLIDLSFREIQTFHENHTFLRAPDLSISISLPPDTEVFQKEDTCPHYLNQSLVWQDNLLKKVMFKIIAKLPLIEGEFNLKSLIAFIKLSIMLKIFSSGDEKMGLAAIINVTTLRLIGCDIFNIELNDLLISVILDSMINYPIFASVNFPSYCVTLDNIRIAQNINENSPIFFQIYKSKNHKLEVYFNIDNILLTAPNYLPQIQYDPEMLDFDIGSNEDNSVTEIGLTMNWNHVFLECPISCLKTRLVMNLSKFHLYYNKNLQFNALFSILSSNRIDLSQNLIHSNSNSLNRIGYNEILSLKIKNGEIFNNNGIFCNLPKLIIAVSIYPELFDVISWALSNKNSVNKTNGNNYFNYSYIKFICNDFNANIKFYDSNHDDESVLGRDYYECILKSIIEFKLQENSIGYKVSSSEFAITYFPLNQKPNTLFEIDHFNNFLIDYNDNLFTKKINLLLELPIININVDNRHIRFISEYVKMIKHKIPIIKQEEAKQLTYVEESLSTEISKRNFIDKFRLVGNAINISANFNYYVNLSLNNVRINMPECNLENIEKPSNLVKQVSLFYMNRFNIFNILTGLPILYNIKNVSQAVFSFLSFQSIRLGFVRGFLIPLFILSQVIMTEYINCSLFFVGILQDLVHNIIDSFLRSKTSSKYDRDKDNPLLNSLPKRKENLNLFAIVVKLCMNSPLIFLNLIDKLLYTTEVSLNFAKYLIEKEA